MLRERLFDEGVVVYGAGGKGRQVCIELTRHDVRIRAIVDRDARPPIDGIPVLSLDEAAHEDLTRLPVVVAVFNHRCSGSEIHHELRRIGFNTVIGFMELRQLYAVEDCYWLAERHEMIPPPLEADWLKQRLQDAKSRDCLDRVIEARKTCDVTRLPEPTIEDQYLPAGLPLPMKDVVFVDGGAYHGETVLDLASRGVNFSRVMCFEPDITNFKILAERFAAEPICQDYVLFPCGLGESTATVSFRIDGLASGRCNESGNSNAVLAPLDGVYRGPPITYLKLDVEGGESEALSGSQRVLSSCRPTVAVAVYHRPSDLWVLPRLLDDLLPRSRFYLRSHGYHGFDLVLYAVP